MAKQGSVRFLPVVPAALIAVAIGVAPAGAAASLAPATVTVTTTADLPSPCPGAVSLRCAIVSADQAGSGVTIGFAIPSSDPGCTGTPRVCTISLTKPLPPLSASDSAIDGYTQTGSAPNTLPLAQGDNARPVIRLDGASAGKGVSGLVVTGATDTVRGLSITGFITCFDCTPIPGAMTGGSGIEVRGTGDVVAGNFLGLLPDGVTAAPNEFAGVHVTGKNAGPALVGGSDPASTNVLSGNKQCLSGDCVGFGAYVETTGKRTVVRRNLIGVTASGTAALPNAATSVVVLAAHVKIMDNVVSGSGGDAILTAGTGVMVSQNLIGTNAAGTAGIGNHSHGLDVQADGNVIRGNVISDSGDTGLVISGTNTIVQGNKIGTDITGTKALGNGFDPSAIFLGQPINGTDGIVVCVGGNTIGGSGAGKGNLVSANRGDGIFLGGDQNVVKGNRVGTDRAGEATLPNHVDGIGSRPFVFDGAGFCQQAPAGPGGSHKIGGTVAGAGNLVSGNLAGGIDLIGTHDDTIAGNRIGTGHLGTAPLGNAGAGLILAGICNEHGCTPSSNNQVTGNLISANGEDGIDIDGTGGGTGNRVAGNHIGTDPSGHPSLGNGGAGVTVGGQATLDVVGGPASSDANVIAGNGGPGIVVGSNAGDSGTNVAVQGNSTFANGGLGIDLEPAGIVNCTTSPPGPNGYLPCPVITSASTTTVQGTACPGCTVEVFLARAGAGDSGHGEGARLLVRVLAQGNGAWTATLPGGSVSSSDQVTATATTPASTVASHTSEFGANLTVGTVALFEPGRVGAPFRPGTGQITAGL